jgi:hypothetical protein
MAGKLNIYNWGDLGVDLVKSPLHIPDGAWRRLQNAEFPTDEGQHAIKKRGSLIRINSSALAGAVGGLTNVPLNYPGDRQLLVGLTTAEDPDSWKTSSNGSSFTDLAAATVQRPVGGQKLSGTFIVGGNFYFPSRGAHLQNLYFFPGDDYIAYPTINFTAPPLVAWDGATSYVMFRVPTNPTSTVGSTPRLITDMIAANDLLYLSVWDHGGSDPNGKGRVLAFNPQTGVLALVGQKFGDGTDEHGRGFPYCLADYLGQLWCGSNAGTGTSGNMGSIWRITPGADDDWIEDEQLSGVQIGVMSLLGYKGKLYAALAVGVGGTALVTVRDPLAQTWATSFTAPATGVSYMGGLVVFDDNLYSCFFKGGTDCLIKQFDGSSWTTDKDVGTDINTDHAPGNPFVFGDELYWPFYDHTSDASQTAFVLKRTAGGTWSTVLDSLGIRGSLGTVIPDTGVI